MSIEWLPVHRGRRQSKHLHRTSVSDQRRPVTGAQESGRGKRMYCAGWMVVTVVIAGLGAVIGLLALPTVGLLELVAALTAFTYVGIHVAMRAPTRVRRLRWLIQAGLVGTGASLSLLGLTKFMGAVGLALVALLAATSPPAAAGCRVVVRAVACLLAPQWTARRCTLSDGQIPAASAGPDTARGPAAQKLTDAELCLAWRRSFVALQRSHGLYQQTRLVRTRQEYLDELERRNPSGFARWLYAGARPASDPSRYLSTVEPDPKPHRRSPDTPHSTVSTP